MLEDKLASVSKLVTVLMKLVVSRGSEVLVVVGDSGRAVEHVVSIVKMAVSVRNVRRLVFGVCVTVKGLFVGKVERSFDSILVLAGVSRLN